MPVGCPARGWHHVEPQAKLARARDWRDDSLTMQAALFDTPFQLHAAKPGSDAAIVGLDLIGWQAEGLKLFIAYDGEFRGNAIAQGITGGIRASW
jgi:subtilase-type serine protease